MDDQGTGERYFALERALENESHRRKELEAMLDEMRPRLLELEARNAELADTERRLRECSAQLSALTKSISWRITKPLRTAKRSLRGNGLFPG